MKDWKDFLALSKDKQLATLNELHGEQLLSLGEIAVMYGTYTNKVRRHAEKINFTYRDRSEAQRNAILTGRSNHPTQGRKRTKEEKTKIGQTVSTKYEKLTKKEKARRAKVSQENWKKKTDAEIEDMNRKATVARLAAAEHGSKLEKILLEELSNLGYVVEFHKEHLLLNEKVHLDLWIPALRTAIEIDGPSHFSPLWGQEKLKKTQQTDNIKDGILLNSGYCIIRIRQEKSVSNAYASRLVSALVQCLQQIERKFPELGERRILIGD